MADSREEVVAPFISPYLDFTKTTEDCWDVFEVSSGEEDENFIRTNRTHIASIVRNDGGPWLLFFGGSGYGFELHTMAELVSILARFNHLTEDKMNKMILPSAFEGVKYGMYHPSWSEPAAFFFTTAKDAQVGIEKSYGKNTQHVVVERTLRVVELEKD